MAILLMKDWVEERLKTPPRNSCAATTPAEFLEWQRSFRRSIKRALGRFPESVPLAPKTLEKTDCGTYTREKVVFHSEPAMAVVAWVLTPRRTKRGQRVPGLVCAHGHGLGKNPLVGLDNNGQVHEDYQHRHAIQFAERGYVTIAPDWRGFGERRDGPPWDDKGRDGCNLRHLAAGYFGFSLLALQIHDGMRCIDYLQSRKEVDPSRIGCVGVSFGGTMTTYLAAMDRRVKAAVISCYLSTIVNGLRRTNFCGAQYMPELRAHGDIPDVALLAAPRPLLAEVGEKDRCFEVDDALQACERVRAGYVAAGHPDRFDVDLFPGEHEFSGRKAFDWFDRWLK
ncbi:MAG TPA: alpha/beta fold hydrolase [Candidatus Latescibacteria bacterium]|nr:alpha/beta fold hydrolase [Candidatus Latescibacterota bacterium]